MADQAKEAFEKAMRQGGRGAGMGAILLGGAALAGYVAFNSIYTGTLAIN